MVGHDDLWDGGHAYSIAAKDPVHLILGRCLEGGSLYADIYTVGDAYLLLPGYGGGLLDEVHVIGLVHVGEARPCGEVLSAQRMLGKEVDVVGDDHQVTYLEGGVHASGSIANEEGLYAQFVHDAHGEGHLLHGVAFVIVEAPLHGHDVHAAELAEDELAGVPFYGGDGEVGNLCIGDFFLVSYF